MDQGFSTPNVRLMNPIETSMPNPYVLKAKPLRRHRVLIDSTYRSNVSTITDYTYEMDVPFFGVERIELARAFFPNSLYLITDLNNTFIINISPVDFSFVIPNGNYTNSELAAAIETAINAHGSFAGYTVTYDTTNSKMTISSPSPTFVTFTVPGASIPLLAPILGFPLEDYPDPASNVVTAPFPMNTSYPQNITLSIGDGSDTFDSLIVPTNASSDNIRCFSYIPLGVSGASSLQESALTVGGASVIVAGGGNIGGHGYFYIPKDATNSYYDFYEGSLGAIKRLQIKIRQVLPTGVVTIPDFNNANHIIELEIVSRTDKNSYTTL